MGRERRERRTVAELVEWVKLTCMPTTPLLDESRWFTYGMAVRRFAMQTRRRSIRFKRRATVTVKRFASCAANYLMTRLGIRSSLSAIDNSAHKCMTVPSKSSLEFRGTPTTRMYPRTLAEAFPNSIERAEWFYPPERATTWKDVVIFMVGVMIWIGLAYYFAKD